MVSNKKRKHPKIADPGELRVIFCRMIEEARSLEMRPNGELVRGRVVDENETSLFVQFSSEQRERYGIRSNQPMPVTFYHEGKVYYGTLSVLGAGKLEGTEALRFDFPGSLAVNDDFGLTRLHLCPRFDVTFTSMFNAFCKGEIVNIGRAGIDMVYDVPITILGEHIRTDMKTDLGFTLSDNLNISVKGRVLYINHVGEPLIGVMFEGLDEAVAKQLDAWINERMTRKKKEDLAFLKDRREARKRLAGSGEVTREGPMLMYDYPTVLHEGDPWILILSRNREQMERIAKVSARKYGVLVSKGRFTNVMKIVEHYAPCLILISEELDTISGFDLARTIAIENANPIPLAITGTEQNLATKQSRARDCKAVNFLTVEPFHPLSFFRAVEDMMKVIMMKRKVTERATAKKAAEAAARVEPEQSGESD